MPWNRKMRYNIQSFGSLLVKAFFRFESYVIVRMDAQRLAIILNPMLQKDFQHSFACDSFCAGVKFDKSAQSINYGQNVVQTVELIHFHKIDEKHVIAKLGYG